MVAQRALFLGLLNANRTVTSAGRAHHGAAKDVDARHAKLIAAHLDVSESDQALYAQAATRRLEPSTTWSRPRRRCRPDWRRSLGLAEPRQHQVGMYVEQAGTFDDGRTYTCHDASGAEKLIARRTAELG